MSSSSSSAPARAGRGPGGEPQGRCRPARAWGKRLGGEEPPGRHLRCGSTGKRGAGGCPAPEVHARAVNTRAGRNTLTGLSDRRSAQAFRPGPWQGAGMTHRSGPRSSSGRLRLSDRRSVQSRFVRHLKKAESRQWAFDPNLVAKRFDFEIPTRRKPAHNRRIAHGGSAPLNPLSYLLAANRIADICSCDLMTSIVAHGAWCNPTFPDLQDPCCGEFKKNG